MKLNEFKDVMDKSFGKRHENISDKPDKLDRNTIIVTALAYYYDYNDLSQEEGREVVKIIMDLQKK